MSEETEEKDGTENFVVTSSDEPVATPEEKVDTPEEDPAKSETEKPTASEKDETKGADEKPEVATGDDPAAETKPPVKKDNRFQKKINEQVRKRGEAERRAERAEGELAKLKGEKEEPAKGKEPVEGDFEQFDDYLDALDKFEKKQPAAKPDPGEKKTDVDQPSQLTDSQKTALAVVQETVDGAKKPKDFKEIALDKSVPISGEMIEALAECDDPAKVMYHLAQNKDVAQGIADSTPAKVAREIAKLDLTVKVIPAKPTQITDSPEPITPVKGSDAQEKTVGEMSFKEHEVYMNKKERESKGGW